MPEPEAQRFFQQLIAGVVSKRGGDAGDAGSGPGAALSPLSTPRSICTASASPTAT